MSRLDAFMRCATVIAASAITLLAGHDALAASLKKQNLTQLIAQSQNIISGKVERVVDGVDDHGMPYTEVTITVSDSAKGSARAGAEYRFRQFGLMKPRKLPSGKTMLSVTPEGFPRWAVGERVVAFMYKPASVTGLQTTTGLAQGKLRLLDGRMRNEFNNEGLFDGVQIREGLLSSKEQAMVSSKGAVDAATFIGLVGRAVNERWIETGGMR